MRNDSVDDLEIQINTIMAYTPLQLAYLTRYRGSTGLWLSRGRRWIDVFYADPSRSQSAQDQFVREWEPLLVEKFGRERVTPRNVGTFKGFRVMVA